MREVLFKYRFELLLGLLISLFIAWFSFFTIYRYQSLHASYYDLGIMDQTVYNTSRGRILELTSPTSYETVKRMAIHNDILLAALAPFYWLYTGPETLLVIQTVTIALGAVFLYLLAKSILSDYPPIPLSPYLPLLFSFSYLMYPPLQWATTYDFHAVSLVTTFFLAFLYFLRKGKYKVSLLILFLCLAAKEQVALVAIFLGIGMVLRPNYFLERVEATKVIKKLGAIIVTISIGWFAASIWYIIPTFRHADHFALARYSQFGDTPHGVITGIVQNPLKIFDLLIKSSSIDYISALLGSLLFISLFSPLILIALPEFAVNLLSNNPNMRDIIFHYTAVITPFVFFSAIYGYLYITKRDIIKAKYLNIVLLILTLTFSYFLSPLPYSRHFDKRILSNTVPEIAAINEWQDKLRDENISVSASDRVATKFVERKTIIRFSSHYKKAEYVILLKADVLSDWYDQKASRAAYYQLVNDKNFSVIFNEGDLYVYRRR